MVKEDQERSRKYMEEQPEKKRTLKINLHLKKLSREQV
jgi:hypothetical protein